MAFTDPQNITVNTVSKSLPLVKSEGYASEYKTADEAYQMRISHQESKGRTRRMVRLDNRVVATDPLTAVSEYKTAGVYIVVDEPEYGFSDTELEYIIQALCDWLTSANIAKVLGNEH